MELRLHRIIDHLYNIFLENDGSENCAQLLEEEVNKMFGTKYLNDEHDCNVLSMNSLNIHDSNDKQSHNLGDAMFDEDDLFSPPTLNDQTCYDGCMPPIYDGNKVAIYDDYCDDTYVKKVVIIIVIILNILLLNITLLMWEQFLVFKSHMILPLL